MCTFFFFYPTFSMFVLEVYFFSDMIIVLFCLLLQCQQFDLAHFQNIIDLSDAIRVRGGNWFIIHRHHLFCMHK